MILESFEVHDTLNPKIWTSDNKLRPEVQDKILKIVQEFKDYIEAPLWVSDIHLVGSNASYNYHDTSDLDVHIVANYDLVDAPKELLQAFYNVQRANFKSTYDISLHGVEVELYVEDINASAVTNGIYSVLEQRWIKFPKKLTNIIQPDIDSDVEEWEKVINDAIEAKDIDTITQLIDDVYLLRKNSLATDGEYGAGNLTFKELRNRELIQKLKDARNELISQGLSLEALQKPLKEQFLREDSVRQLLNKSKSSEEGAKRFAKRVKSHIQTSPAQYNQIDMNKLFTTGILTVDLEVRGETDTYSVKISYGGFLDILHDTIRRDKIEEVDLKVITRTLITGFNRGDVFVHCSCDDFKMRYNYYATVNNINSGEAENRKSEITNPDDSLGIGCKHILLVLTNTSWILKCATVIYNYIVYMKEHQESLYKRVLYPAIYNKKYEEPKEEKPAEESSEETK